MSGIHKGESVVNCLKTYSTPRLRLGANCCKKRRTRAGSAQSNSGPKPANALWTNVGENGYPAPGGQSHRSGSTDSREHRGAARALALTASPRRPPNLRRVMETPSPATALGAALSMPRSEAWFREPHYRRREGGARVAEAELVKIRQRPLAHAACFLMWRYVGSNSPASCRRSQSSMTTRPFFGVLIRP